MIDKAIDLLKMLVNDIKNYKPLCPFPHRNLICSVFLNSDRRLREEFINAFSMNNTDNFYKAILIMATANASSGRAPNDIVESVYGGCINRAELVKIIEDMLEELSRYNVSEKSNMNERNEMKEHDVFISHANKDKEDFVEKLYQSLNKLGVDIFYDKESLEWGDNWKNRILNGTKSAEFAIIIISGNFFDREWTERELTEFLNRQNDNGQKLILPILHNITVEQLYERYPTVADIQAIDSKEYTCDEIALMFARQLIKRIKGI